MSSLPQLLVGAVVAVALTWLVFLGMLLAFRPRGVDPREAVRLAPDLVRTIRSMSKDPTLSRGVKRWLGVVLVYLVSPIDIVPDFLPGIGQVDDVVVTALVLRHLVRRVGYSELARHWAGSPTGLEVIERLVGIRRT